jgi:hypothetical protein
LADTSAFCEYPFGKKTLPTIQQKKLNLNLIQEEKNNSRRRPVKSTGQATCGKGKEKRREGIKSLWSKQ